MATIEEKKKTTVVKLEPIVERLIVVGNIALDKMEIKVEEVEISEPMDNDNAQIGWQVVNFVEK